MVVLVRVLISSTGSKCPDLPVTITVDSELRYGASICVTLNQTSVKRAKLWKKSCEELFWDLCPCILCSLAWSPHLSSGLDSATCCRLLVTVTKPDPLLFFGHCGTAPLVIEGTALLTLLAPSLLPTVEQPTHAAAFPCTQGDFNNAHPCNKLVAFPSLLFHCLFLLEKELNENLMLLFIVTVFVGFII